MKLSAGCILVDTVERHAASIATSLAPAMAPIMVTVSPVKSAPDSIVGLLTDDGSQERLTAACQTFPNLRFIAYMAHGGSDLLGLRLRKGVRLLRLRDPYICQSMVQYVTLHLLAFHRHLDAYRQQQRHRVWKPIASIPVDKLCIAILGLGAIGAPIARNVASLGFAVRGWSRTQKSIIGVQSYCGSIGDVLQDADVVVNVLPGTYQTRHVLGPAELRRLRQGAAVINVGRGMTLDIDALRSALRSGQIGYAALDVTDPEPLPPNHPLWHEPNVVLTPHVAGSTATISIPELAKMLRAAVARRYGQWLVDATRGY